MSDIIKDINIKKPHVLLFNDIINIKDFDPNNIKTDEKSYKNIIYYIRYVTVKNLKVDIVNPLYFIFNKVNRYFAEINGNNYLTSIHTKKRKKKTIWKTTE